MIKISFKKSIFIIITFTVISFIFSLFTSFFQSIYSVNKENTDFLSENALKIRVQDVPTLNKKDFQFFQSLNKNILMYKDLSKPLYKGIYFSGNKTPKVPMKSGRFFTKEDFENDTKLAIVGSEVFTNCTVEDNKHYFDDESGRYLVIGVMGSDDKKTYLDSSVYVNLNSVFQKGEFDYSSGFYYIDCGKESIATFEKFKKYLTSKRLNIVVESFEDDRLKSPFLDLLSGAFSGFVFIALILVCLALNTVSLTTDWIENKEKELAIRKTFGGTDKQISRRILLEYEFIVTSSFILGFILYVIFIKSKIFDIPNMKVYFFSSAITYIFCLIVGRVTAIVPMRKAMKLEVSEILR